MSIIPVKACVVMLIVINILSFMLYGIDKYKAVNHKWRIRESVLLAFAAAFGGIGALTGMKFFHHKTQKPKFMYGVPVMAVIQIFFIAFILKR